LNNILLHSSSSISWICSPLSHRLGGNILGFCLQVVSDASAKLANAEEILGNLDMKLPGFDVEVSRLLKGVM
jgi:hypothetical protein